MTDDKIRAVLSSERRLSETQFVICHLSFVIPELQARVSYAEICC
jgi:hypothetical protein